MKKLFTLFAGMIIASAAWADEYVLKDTISTSELQTFFDNEPRAQRPEEALEAQWFEPMVISTGFNRDVIAEEIDSLYDSDGKLVKTISPIKRGNDTIAISYFNTEKEWTDPANAGNEKKQLHSYTYITEGAMRIKGPANEVFSAFPDDGRVECISDYFPGLYWLMGDYKKKNALCLREGITKTGKFVFKNIGCYQKLYFLAAAVGSGDGVKKMDAVVYYSDNTSDSASFTFLDHAKILISIKDTVKEDGVVKYGSDGKPKMETKYVVTTQYREHAACHDNFGNPPNKNDLKSFSYGNKTSYARVCEMEIDQHRLIDSISFISKLTGKDIGLVVFAVTGKVAKIGKPVASGEATEITDNSFHISWGAVDDAQSYRVDVATDEDFHHMIDGYNNQTVIGTDTTITNVSAGTDYYWRVRAVNDEGGQGKSSDREKVTTKGDPATREDAIDIEAEMATLKDAAQPVDLTIVRTLYKDGYFNTLCLPFDLASLEGTPIAGGELYKFLSARAEGESLLEINISPVSGNAVEAGKPYLIRWANPGETLTELVFRGVTVTASEGLTIGGEDEVQFVGHIGMEQIEYENHYNLFLGEKNQLYWPINDGTIMKGFRAYFAIPTGKDKSSAPVKQGTPARLSIHPNVPTSVATTEEQRTTPVKIIENGQLVIIRNGVRYNAAGQQLH